MPKSRKTSEKGANPQIEDAQEICLAGVEAVSPPRNRGDAATPTARKGKNELVICHPDAKAPICISRELLDLT